jgi:hypothetical protein
MQSGSFAGTAINSGNHTCGADPVVSFIDETWLEDFEFKGVAEGSIKPALAYQLISLSAHHMVSQGIPKFTY